MMNSSWLLRCHMATALAVAGMKLGRLSRFQLFSVGFLITIVFCHQPFKTTHMFAIAIAVWFHK